MILLKKGDYMPFLCSEKSKKLTRGEVKFMRTLYLDCGMGAAGDMLMAALLELVPDREAFVQKMNALGVPGVTVEAQESVKCGITGTHMRIRVNGMEEHELHHHDDAEHEHHHHHDDAEHEHHHHHHHHSGMTDIEHIVSHMQVSDKVKRDILAVYGLIAEAESNAHGKPVSEIHFHEVGALDAVMDVAGVCILMEMLAPAQVVVSPVHVGSGQVRCAHGILPVPAPATAYILQEVPIYGGKVRGELCTPTGAALLKYFATDFGEMPVMTVHSIGYGMGTKDFEAANCVRSMLGETKEQGDVIAELSCNLDDMTAEEVGYAMDRLLAGGALDVYTVPIGMKKSRPGVMLCVLCREQDKEEMVRLLFRHTKTLGIREKQCSRYTLHRSIETIETEYGPVRKKTASGYGVTRAKYEYEDLARIAGQEACSIDEIRKKL